jgi:ligand-binding SRPBCC domain-containing protein
VTNLNIHRYLQTFSQSFVVNSHIDRVWEFYTDIQHLEIITQKEMNLKITHATNQRLAQGSEIWLEAKLLIFRKRWHSVIRSLMPYEYIDEMLTGPYKTWTHLHRFYEIDERNKEKQTEVIDEVNFEIPYSPIGKLFEGYVYRRLQTLFDHRKVVTIRTIEHHT